MTALSFGILQRWLYVSRLIFVLSVFGLKFKASYRKPNFLDDLSRYSHQHEVSSSIQSVKKYESLPLSSLVKLPFYNFDELFFKIIEVRWKVKVEDIKTTIKVIKSSIKNWVMFLHTITISMAYVMNTWRRPVTMIPVVVDLRDMIFDHFETKFSWTR